MNKTAVSAPTLIAIMLGFICLDFMVLALGTHVEAPAAIGMSIGALIGSLILCAILWPILRLIRGKAGGPDLKNFLGVALPIFLCITLGAQFAKSNRPSSTAPLAASADTPTSTAAPSPLPAAAPAADQFAAWPVPPLVRGDWTIQDKRDSRIILDNLVQASPAEWVDIAHEITQFRCASLSFYAGGFLCEGLLPARTGVFEFVLLKSGEAIPLDGTSAPIYKANQKAPLNVDKQEAAESYLRFFSAALFTSGGNFRIVDTVDDLLWGRDATAADREKAARLVRPMAIKQEDGSWTASVTVQYQAAIFTAFDKIATNPSDPDNPGLVNMTNDVPLANNLPLRRDAFKGPVRYEIGLYK